MGAGHTAGHEPAKDTRGCGTLTETVHTSGIPWDLEARMREEWIESGSEGTYMSYLVRRPHKPRLNPYPGQKASPAGGRLFLSGQSSIILRLNLNRAWSSPMAGRLRSERGTGCGVSAASVQRHGEDHHIRGHLQGMRALRHAMPEASACDPHGLFEREGIPADGNRAPGGLHRLRLVRKDVPGRGHRDREVGGVRWQRNS